MFVCFGQIKLTGNCFGSRHYHAKGVGMCPFPGTADADDTENLVFEQNRSTGTGPVRTQLKIVLISKQLDWFTGKQWCADGICAKHRFQTTAAFCQWNILIFSRFYNVCISYKFQNMPVLICKHDHKSGAFYDLVQIINEGRCDIVKDLIFCNGFL